jgi:hypothetical protein
MDWITCTLEQFCAMSLEDWCVLPLVANYYCVASDGFMAGAIAGDGFRAAAVAGDVFASRAIAGDWFMPGAVGDGFVSGAIAGDLEQC